MNELILLKACNKYNVIAQTIKAFRRNNPLSNIGGVFCIVSIENQSICRSIDPTTFEPTTCVCCVTWQDPCNAQICSQKKIGISFLANKSQLMMIATTTDDEDDDDDGDGGGGDDDRRQIGKLKPSDEFSYLF